MRRATTIAVIAMVQFAMCLPLSVLCYPGRYRFSRQYLSELGCGGGLHAWLFNLSLFSTGCGLAWFFAILTRHTFRGNPRLPIVGVCGTLASLSLAGVGAIPMDVQEPLHVAAMLSWLLLMLPMSAAWISWLTWQRYSIGWMILNKSLGLAIGIYLPAFVFGYAAMWQKVVVLVSFLWMTILWAEIIVIIWKNGLPRLQRREISEINRERSAVALARMAKHKK